MKIEYRDESGTEYIYNESALSGKKQLTVNGVEAKALSKKTFQLPDNREATLKGNFMSGVSLQMSNGQSVVLCKNLWYEWILMLMPLLVLGVGIFGGAIGGGLSGVFGFLGAIFNAVILRTKMNVFLKVLCCIGVLILVFIAWFLIFALIVGGLSLVFPSLFG